MSEANRDPLAVISMAIRDGERAIIGAGVLNRFGRFLDQDLGPRCTIVSDANIEVRFGERLTKILETAGFEPMRITIPAGEQFKTLEQAGAIYDQMIASRLDRQSFVIGLGGGVIGDISGFVAAIFHRGIPHVQIPTTLLAMVDSSIGGKTGVNTRDGKNLIGTIHHPVLVIDDVDLLKTLPPREFNQGFAEIVKHAITFDADMFATLHQIAAAKLDRINQSSLIPLIRRNVEIKAAVVAKDERDRTGERALLNFGHTVGHAIERAGDYTIFWHGEAVSLGMIAACHVSMKKAGLPREQRGAIVDLLRTFDLPTQLPSNFPRQKIFEALPLDKKFESGNVRFVVTPRIGSAYLSSDVTMEDIREAILHL